MKHADVPMQRRILSLRLGLCFGILAGLLGPLSQAKAQTIYRIVAPNGKVTFSDKSTADAAAVKMTSTDAGEKPMGAQAMALPFELRQIVSKYPVTLYSADNCAPCNTGRTLLTHRGIVFAEKTVNTPEDVQALQRLSGGNALPLLTLGAQQIRGFSESDWTQFLDAAGYPKSSALPAGYRHPAAMPLAPAPTPAPAAPAEANSAAPSAATPTNESPTSVERDSNPAGIQF